jgi:type VI secretion system protein ImpA
MTTSSTNLLSRYADLLEPVSADAPCGPDLEYDQAFVLLHAALAPKTDAQYGNFVDSPQPVNWAEVERDCRALLARTRDIRLLVVFARCRIRQSGAAGLCDGLALLLHTIERFGETVHPAQVFDGERDPVMYANAIAALADASGTLGDVRDIALPKAGGLQLQVRDIEKAFIVPRVKEALTPDTASRLLKELWVRQDPTVVSLANAQHLVADLGKRMRDALGDEAPSLQHLEKLLRPFAQATLESSDARAANVRPAVQPQSADVPEAAAASTGTVATSPLAMATAAHPQALDRWSALESIRATRLWFERNEPSSPVIVLLRQSERLVGKRFSEVVNAIPPELLAQWDAIDL